MSIIRRITHHPAARVAWRVLAFAACLSALLPASSAQAQANEIVTKQLTVVTVPVPPSQQNPGGLETQLIQIPDSSKLKINQDNAPKTPSSKVVVGGNAPLKVNTATGWGASTDPMYAGKSGAPTCGGYWNGKLQPKCPSQPATYVSEAVGACPAGSFVDLGAWGCYACPAGFNRTGDPVTSATACSKADASVSLQQMGAKLAGSLCPGGGFFDIIRGGECYTCPEGYRRSAAHVEASNACFVPAGERFARATRHQKTIWPHDCKNGRFFDGWDGGGCWTCPAGYNRTGNHIADANACSQGYGEQHARATNRGKAECKAGEFFDPRNNGECWTCPEGTYRTVHPVTGNQACERRAGVQLTKATQVSGFSCPANTFLDLISSRHPDARWRIEKQIVETGKRVSYGNSDGGTCWSCPPGYTRDIYHVASNAACLTSSIDWKPAPYVQPGLFGLDGASEVAQAVLAEGTQLESLIAAMAADNDTPLAQIRKEVYEEIATAPESSSLLAAAVYMRLEAAVKNPAQATLAEKRLVASLAEAIRLYRVFIAQNALDMFDQWSEALMRQASDAAQKAGPGSVEQQRMNQLAYKGGEIPPDFKIIASEMIAANILAPMSAQAFAMASTGSPQLLKRIFPNQHTRKYVRGVAGKFVEKIGGEVIEDAVEEVIEQVTKQVAQKTAKVSLKSMVKALSKAGPQILFDVTIEAVTVVIEHYEAVLNARPKLVTNLAGAKQPVDMLREFNANEDWLYEQWATSLGGGNRGPQNLGTFASLATAAAAKAPPVQTAPLPTDNLPKAPAQINAPKVWLQMPGAATDIGMGGGTLWAIGSSAAPGDQGVYRWDGKTWVDMKGKAVRLDVTQEGNAWVVNEKGEIWRHDGRSWNRVAGVARDIGIGARGDVWAIGAQPVQGGFEIFRQVGGNWQKVPGGGVRIDVDPQGNAWVVSDGGDVFRYTGSGWAGVPGIKARDIGVGGNGSVFVVGQDGSVHKWNGQSWVKRDGRLAEITADAQGIPFGTSDNKQIWMGYP